MVRNYLVYKLQCPINGKIYIGVTCQRPELRWRNGQKYSGDLKADIEKYGWESFSKEILETGLLTVEAAKREKEYIKKYSTKAVLYNATAGGEVRQDYDIDRMAEKMRGRKLTALAKEHISKARKGMVFFSFSSGTFERVALWQSRVLDREEKRCGDHEKGFAEIIETNQMQRDGRNFCEPVRRE